MSLKNNLLEIYARFFCRPFFSRLNNFIFHLGLRGMGILLSDKTNVESGEAWFIEHFCKNRNNQIIIDVGSNEGNYSKEIKFRMPNATIYAFEPHPITFGKLKKTAKKYSFNAYNYGCGDTREIVDIFDHKNRDGSGHASLYKSVIENIHNSNACNHQVEIIKLDDFINDNNIDRIDLLKIDAEGHELKILDGLSSTLKENKIDIIHFEFNEMNVISRVFFSDFYNLLTDYKFFRMLRVGLLPINNYSPINCELFAFQNILAIKKNSHFFDKQSNK